MNVRTDYSFSSNYLEDGNQVIYAGGPHGFSRVFHVTDGAREMIDEIKAGLRADMTHQECQAYIDEVMEPYKR